MKKIIISFSVCLFALININAQEEEFATSAAEDFDLNAVIEILKDVKDIDELEKKINSEDSQINNLDLNKDGDIDMIKVVEYDEGETRLFVIRAIISEKESQDIATIEIEKHSDGEVSLQVVGDPDIYGADYIIEPSEASKGTTKYIIQPSKEYLGFGFNDEIHIPNFTYVAVFVSVRRWKPIGPLFTVGRIAFVSSVGWRAVPVWFVVRRPIARSTWRGRSRRSNVRRSNNRHSSRGRNMYSNKRSKSNVAKKNSGPKATPASKKSTKPNTQQKKKTNTSKATPTSKNSKKPTTSKKSNKPNTQQKKKTKTPPKKKGGH